jgi:hypothetical protein
MMCSRHRKQALPCPRPTHPACTHHPSPAHITPLLHTSPLACTHHHSPAHITTPLHISPLCTSHPCPSPLVHLIPSPSTTTTTTTTTCTTTTTTTTTCREAEERLLKEKPRSFVQELVSTTVRSKPNTPAALRNKPMLAYSLDLEAAAGAGSDSKRGTAVFRLYTGSDSSDPHNDTVFEDFQASWAQRSYMPCAFSTIMEVGRRLAGGWQAEGLVPCDVPVHIIMLPRHLHVSAPPRLLAPHPTTCAACARRC